MGTYMLNSVIVTALALLLLIVISLPAAYVLSRSSIEPGKIVEKMASIKDEKQLRLLLWILTERLGNQTSNYLEQNILENEYIVDKTNLQKALLLLKSVPHTHDLLPAIHQNL